MTRFSAISATIAGAFCLALAPSAAFAQMHDQAHSHAQQVSAPAQDTATLSSGEVNKVDKDTGKLTIQHGPLANLNMPGMTMVFKAADRTMLDQVKAGDQIRFRAEMVNGAFTVTRLELAR